MSDDLALQLDMAVRIVVASLLGAVIGLERELHAHPAGMRTHLLVSFGSALFTVLSIYGFVNALGPAEGSPPDPTRIAAQIVTGIGFLGAGAILKYGTSIRGLTTAGSLWATAAIGMAAGAGEVILALVGTAIVVFSLWPLNWAVARLRIGQGHAVRVRLNLARLEALGTVTTLLASHRIEIAGIQSHQTGKDRYEVELHLRPPPGVNVDGLVGMLTADPDVELLETIADSE